MCHISREKSGTTPGGMKTISFQQVRSAPKTLPIVYETYIILRAQLRHPAIEWLQSAMNLITPVSRERTSVTVHGLTIPSSLCCVCVCVQVSVCGCVWLRLIRSSWGSFTGAILDPVTLSCVVRSSDCLPCHGQWFSSVPASCFRDSWSLPFLDSITGHLAAHCFPALRAPTYGELNLVSSVSPVWRVCNKPFLFPKPESPVFIHDRRIWPQYGFSGDSWFSGTVSQQQRSYGSTGGEYVEHRMSCAGVSSAGVRAHHPVATIKITRCAIHTADSPSPREQQPSARTQTPYTGSVYRRS